jgi:hypothetical protein
MDYNQKKGIYEKAILIKQGFTNYEYTIADAKGKIDNENAIDGSIKPKMNTHFSLLQRASTDTNA